MIQGNYHRGTCTSEGYLHLEGEDADHNCGDIKKTGFTKILVEMDRRPLLIKNPKWKP